MILLSHLYKINKPLSDLWNCKQQSCDLGVCVCVFQFMESWNPEDNPCLLCVCLDQQRINCTALPCSNAKGKDTMCICSLSLSLTLVHYTIISPISQSGFSMCVVMATVAVLQPQSVDNVRFSRRRLDPSAALNTSVVS